MQNDRKEDVFGLQSLYAFLAFDPAFALEDKYQIELKWKPFQLRLKEGERSQYSEFRRKTLYMDARRWANMRGGLMIRGPLNIFPYHSCTDRGALRGKVRKDFAIWQQSFRIVFQARTSGGRA